MKHGVKWLFIAAAVLLLAGCAREDPLPTEATEPPKIEKLTQVVTENNIGELENYPDLKEVNLCGSTCYDQILQYRQKHPQVKVTYTVALGSRAAVSGTKNLTLRTGEYDYDTLTENLAYLDSVEALSFPEAELTAGQIRELREKYPQIAIDYTVSLNGEPVGVDTQTLDLSWAAPEELGFVSQKLSLLPNLTQVELMDGESCNLTVADVSALQTALPNVAFHYTFELFGKTVSTTDERIEFKNQKIGDEGEEELRQALSLMRGTYVLLDNCRFSNELLARLRDEYRDNAKLVWRVWFGKNGSCTTDREVIRAVYGLTDKNCHDLVYCEDARFCDFGHDDTLTDCSFVAGMPKLEAIILSGSSIKDLSSFAGCKKLEFLEIAYCGLLTDISPLAQCESLKRLNIAFTKVSDLSPLDELPMEVMVAMGAKTDTAEQTRFQEKHPDCITSYKGTQPYSYPWRYVDNGVTPNEYYAMLREVFDYDHAANTVR